MNTTVQNVLEGLGQAASTLGVAIGGRTGDAMQVAGTLTETVGTLLDTRSPDEVIELLRDLNQSPARRAHLDTARARVARILDRRRADEASD